MTILDRILDFVGIKRINLDQPLSLLGKYYHKVMDKVYASPYGIEEDIDWGVMYYKFDEENPNVQVCAWETRKIVHTIKHDEKHRVVAAGRCYIDKDKDFLEGIVKKVTAGKRRIYGKVDYCHYGRYDSSGEEYYSYNDDVYILVYRDSYAYDHGHCVFIEYVLRDKPEIKARRTGKKSSRPRTIKDDRERMMNDVKKHMDL